MFLTHITSDDIIHAFASLSKSNAIGSDGFLPEIIKQNAVYLSHQLAYIFNLFFFATNLSQNSSKHSSYTSV
jgi:hypothetical protein